MQTTSYSYECWFHIGLGFFTRHRNVCDFHKIRQYVQSIKNCGSSAPPTKDEKPWLTLRKTQIISFIVLTL